MTSLVERVPFPAPGFPNINILRNLPSPDAELAPEFPWRENGRAFCGACDRPKPLDGLSAPFVGPRHKLGAVDGARRIASMWEYE